MKKILLVILVLAVKSVFAHEINYEKVILKDWNLEGKTLKASFLFNRNDSVFVEDANHMIIGFPINKFSDKDKIYINKKINQLNDLNKQLNENLVTDSYQSKPIVIVSLLTFLIILSIIIFSYSVFKQKKQLKYIIPIFLVGASTFLLSFTDPYVIRNAFLPFAPNVNTFWDNNYFYVESKGIPTTHEMMVGISNHGWQQQVPIPQCYIGNNSWSIPLNPIMATNPIPVDQTHFTRGAIAVAVNGVPIFNPYTNTGVDAYLDGQLDNFGGHCGRADDYHYHTAPLHLYNQTSSTLPIAYAFDGFAVYGSLEPDGNSMTPLDTNHGHTYNGEYHYHGTASAPYMIAKFAGIVTEDATHQLIPQAQASPVRTENWTPLNGALITSCTLNNTNNGYNLSYTLNGSMGYATNYFWNGTTYTFSYVTPFNTNNINYNGFSQCNVLLSIHENFNVSKNEIFPNPFTHYLQVKNSHNNQYYMLYNSLGELIFSGKNIENHNFSGLAKGVYFLQIKEKNINFKLIKN